MMYFTDPAKAADHMPAGKKVVSDLIDGDIVYHVVDGYEARNLAQHRAVLYLSRYRSREGIDAKIDTDVHDGWILDNEAQAVREALARIRNDS